MAHSFDLELRIFLPQVNSNQLHSLDQFMVKIIFYPQLRTGLGVLLGIYGELVIDILEDMLRYQTLRNICCLSHGY